MFQTQAEALQVALQLEENQYQKTNPAIEEVKEDFKNLTFQLNQNKNKEKNTTRMSAQLLHNTWKHGYQALFQ
jgi:hypothetical protein